MNKLTYHIGGHLTKLRDAVYILEGEEPLDELVDAAIQAIATDVEITCGGVTLHLAAWQDPEHWSEDWAAAGVPDVSAFVASLVEEMP